MLFNEINALSKAVEITLLNSTERLKARKGRFNLFTTLLKSHDETRLHSRFIHFLLNPDESHDCGDLFLKAFAEAISDNKDLSCVNSIIEKEFKYGRTEQPTNERRYIDIFLEFKGGRIAIENKVWASEQSEQIQHYSEFISSSNDENLLLYLTLDGKKSQTDNGTSYSPISYKEHILKWLDLCLSRTYEFVNLNIALQQYRTVVRELLGRNHYMEDVKSIKEQIQKCPSFIENFEIIHQSVVVLHNDAWKIILHDIKSELEKIEGITFDNEAYCGDAEDPRAHTGDTLLRFGNKYTDLKFHLGIFRSDNNRIAIAAYPPEEYGHTIVQLLRREAEHVFLALKQKYPHNEIFNEWWLIYYRIEACNTPLTNSSFVAKILDSEARAKIIEEIVKEIKDLVKDVHEFSMQYRNSSNTDS